MQHIEQTGKHPITGEPLSIDELIPLQGSTQIHTPRIVIGVDVVAVGKSVTPRPATAVSIPSMLQLFQNEWDSVMLESFNLRKQLELVCVLVFLLFRFC